MSNIASGGAATVRTVAQPQATASVALSPTIAATNDAFAPLENYTEIVPNLFVGNYRSAKQVDEFDVIVNCTTHIPFYAPLDKERQIWLPVLDTPAQSERLYSLIRQTNALPRIHAALTANKRVLIHCHMGAQRSATVAAAYLMAYYNVNVDEAIAYVHDARPIALIWVNFRRTLELIWANLRR